MHRKLIFHEAIASWIDCSLNNWRHSMHPWRSTFRNLNTFHSRNFGEKNVQGGFHFTFRCKILWSKLPHKRVAPENEMVDSFPYNKHLLWTRDHCDISDSSNVITIRFYSGCSGKCFTRVSTVSSLVTFKTTSLNWMSLVMRQLILVWRIFQSNPRHLMVIIQCAISFCYLTTLFSFLQLFLCSESLFFFSLHNKETKFLFPSQT